MAKDPICGMFVEEKSSSIKHTSNEGVDYYFCSSGCLDEFTAPEKEMKRLKMHVISSIIFCIPIIILTYIAILPETINNFVLLALATPVQFWIGWRFYKGFWDSVKAKAANMDTLIAIGTSAAYFYSTIITIFPRLFPFEDVYFETAAIIITLLLIGRLLETRTKEKASNAVRKLLNLQPRMAKVIKKDTEEEVEIPVERVQEDDIMIIRPGEKIPTDGIILKGSSSIDESLITGESIPVDKTEGDEVIGSSINKSGLIQVKVTKVGRDTVLSNIIKMVESARTGKAPIQKMADQVAKYFVPIVVTIAIVSGFGWYFLGGIGLTFSLLAFVSVMIIACPCALGIATPAALMIGSGKAAENGILFKGGDHLEIAKKIKTIVFDKTGTLTKGKPEVTDVIILDDNDNKEKNYQVMSSDIYDSNDHKPKKITNSELLRLIAIAEKGSEHPLGKAIVKKAIQDSNINGDSISTPDSFESISGHGLKATYGKHVILIGNRKLMKDNNVFSSKKDEEFVNLKLKDLEIEGKTAIIVSIDHKLSGIIAISDTLKEYAKETVDSLKSMGINVIMLTGDNINTAKAIASKLGIENIIADVLPHEKERVIRDLLEQAEKKEVTDEKSMKFQEKSSSSGAVAMVGDGINDAPALAKADLGIAIGSGTDVAKETGGIILIKDDLRDIVTALDLGKKTVTKIKQNLFWAFVYNTGLIPVAAGILVPFLGPNVYSWLPFLAASAMAFSSVTVVGNSLLLGRYKPKIINQR
ncbi:MAG: heavy metal translocating P-type ATPase [Nitrososphaeraceae archaeon]